MALEARGQWDLCLPLPADASCPGATSHPWTCSCCAHSVAAAPACHSVNLLLLLLPPPPSSPLLLLPLSPPLLGCRHIYGHLRRELEQHSDLVNKFIVIHDTVIDAVGAQVDGWGVEGGGWPPRSVAVGAWVDARCRLQGGCLWWVSWQCWAGWHMGGWAGVARPGGRGRSFVCSHPAFLLTAVPEWLGVSRTRPARGGARGAHTSRPGAALGGLCPPPPGSEMPYPRLCSPACLLPCWGPGYQPAWWMGHPAL